MKKELISLCDELIKDENILDILKEPILGMVNSGNIKLNENQEDIEILIDKLYESFNICFSELIDSIERLKSDYYEIYTLNKNLFDTISKIANQYKDANECWLTMNEDKELARGISRLVALWLTSDYSLQEKESYYLDIRKEIYNNDADNLIKSVNLIKSKYAIIYDFKKEFFDELEVSTMDVIINPIVEYNDTNSNLEKFVDKFMGQKFRKLFTKK